MMSLEFRAQSSTNTSRWRARSAAICLLKVSSAVLVATAALAIAAPAVDAVVPATIQVASGGINSVAVDSASHMIYAAQPTKDVVDVVNAQTNTVTDTIPVGAGPNVVAVDPTTHTVYVANTIDHSVSEIDGTTDTVTHTVQVGPSTVAMAVNPVTHSVYVVDQTLNSVMVIDGSSVTATVGAGGAPDAVTVDPTRNLVFVADNFDGTVVRIDGTSNTVTGDIVGVDTNPIAIGVDPAQNTVFVLGTQPGTSAVDEIDETAMTASGEIPVGPAATDLVVDPTSHRLYVAIPAGQASGVLEIQGDRNVQIVDSVGAVPTALAVDDQSGAVYVATGNVVRALSGVTNSLSALGQGISTVGTFSSIDQSTRFAWGADLQNALRYDLTTNSTSLEPVGDGDLVGEPAADNGLVYYPNGGSGNVVVIDGTAGSFGSPALATVKIGTAAFAVAVDSSTHLAYASDPFDATVSVIDPSTFSVTHVIHTGTAGTDNPEAIAVDPVTHVVYVTVLEGGTATVDVIDGSTNTITATFSAPNDSSGIAVDTATDTLLITNGEAVWQLNPTTGAIRNKISIAPPLMLSPPLEQSPIWFDPSSGAAFVFTDATGISGMTTIDETSGTAVSQCASFGGCGGFDSATHSLFIPESGGAGELYNFSEVPSVPTITSTTFSAQLSVTWSAPQFDGGNPISSYAVAFTPLDGSAATVDFVPSTQLSDTLTGLDPEKLYSVTVTADNAAGASSPSAAVVETAHATVTTLAPSANPATTGSSVTYSATVTPSPGVGSVAFFDNGGPITSCAAQPLDASGIATCAQTYGSPGAHGVTAIFNGNAAFTSSVSPVVVETINAPAATTTATTLASSANPANTGSSVTFSATVSPVPNGGTVAFFDNGAPIASCAAKTLTAGVATCAQTYGSAGTHGINALYSGNSAFSSSVSTTLVETVNTPAAAPTATTLAPSANPATTGNAVTYSATVTPTPDGGTVAFFDNGAPIASCTAKALTVAVATCAQTYGTPGAHAITATYSGDASFTSSVSPSLIETVSTQSTASATPTATSLGSSSNPATTGTVTFSATVTPTPDGGTVTFFDNGSPLASCAAQALSAGVATCAHAYGTPGAHAITAAYNGDAAFDPSVSTSLDQTVSSPTPTSTSTSLHASANPATTGSAVTYSATVTPTSDGGTVAFFDNGAPIAACGAQALSAGTASCTQTYGSPGAHAVTAAFSGDAAFAASVSPSLVETINAAPVPGNGRPAHGYWMVGSDGGVFTFGSAGFFGSTGNLALQRPVVGMAPSQDHFGYWLVASDGGLFAFGDASYFGSVPGLGLHPAGSGLSNSLNAPIVAMVPSVDGGGYFMVGRDGGVFAFGDAAYEGSCPGIGGCAGQAVSVAPDASGHGYWLLTSTGDVYAFGDAAYLGAPGTQTSHLTSLAATPDGQGYWALSANGGVFAYGDAANLGSVAPGGAGVVDPATSIFPTSDAGGYWVVNASGVTFAFGDAPNDGDLSSVHLNRSIIAGAGF